LYIWSLISYFNTAYATLPNDTDTTPQFTVVQETTKYQVFVLDVSGSMSVSRNSFTIKSHVIIGERVLVRMT